MAGEVLKEENGLVKSYVFGGVLWHENTDRSNDVLVRYETDGPVGDFLLKSTSEINEVFYERVLSSFQKHGRTF